MSEQASVEAIHTEDAPAAIGPYSQAVSVGDLVFTAGQVGFDPGGGTFVGADVASQTRQALENIRAILRAAGTDLDRVVKTTIFLADIDDFEVVNEVYGEFFEAPYPARSTVQAGRLPKDARVEIEAVARRSGPAG